MPLDVDAKGVTVTNDGRLSGAPALRVHADGVTFINMPNGEIGWQTGSFSGGPVIQVTGARFTLINQSGGSIKASSDGHVAIEGSAFADRIENWGHITGSVLLGAGDDYYWTFVDRGGVLSQICDLGSGDDVLAYDITQAQYIHLGPVIGGPGFDQIYISGIARSFHGGGVAIVGNNLSGIERISLETQAGITGSVSLYDFVTSAEVRLGASMSTFITGGVNSLAPVTAKVGDVYMLGGQLEVGRFTELGNVYGSDLSETITFVYPEDPSTAGKTGSIFLGGGADVFHSGTANLSGGVYGGTGNDLLTGGGQAVALHGDEGDDKLVGGRGDNTLTGGDGNDTLIGGGGADKLTGGMGADRFGFNFDPWGANADFITDFTSGVDQISLSPCTFYSEHGIRPTDFVIGPAAQDPFDRLVYDKATGAIYYDADGSGILAPQLFARLAPGTELTGADFILEAIADPVFAIPAADAKAPIIDNGKGAIIATDVSIDGRSKNFIGGSFFVSITGGHMKGDRIQLAEVEGVSVAGSQVFVGTVGVGRITVSQDGLLIMDLNGDADDAAVTDRKSVV